MFLFPPPSPFSSVKNILFFLVVFFFYEYCIHLSCTFLHSWVIVDTFNSSGQARGFLSHFHLREWGLDCRSSALFLATNAIALYSEHDTSREHWRARLLYFSHIFCTAYEHRSRNCRRVSAHAIRAFLSHVKSQVRPADVIRFCFNIFRLSKIIL